MIKKKRKLARKIKKKPQKDGFFFTLSKKTHMIIIFILACAYFYVFLISPIFEIKTLTVINNQSAGSNKREIEKLVGKYIVKKKWLIFSNRNIWIISKKGIMKAVGEYVSLKDIKLKRKPPNHIEIKIEEKIPSLVWNKKSGEEWYLDENGKAIKQKKVGGFNYGAFVVENATTTEIDITRNSEVIDKKAVDAILNAKKIFDTLIRDFSIIKARYDINKKRELTLVTNEDWLIFADIENDMRRVAREVDLVIQKKVKTERLNLSYIDARIPGKLFIKYK